MPPSPSRTEGESKMVPGPRQEGTHDVIIIVNNNAVQFIQPFHTQEIYNMDL